MRCRPMWTRWRERSTPGATSGSDTCNSTCGRAARGSSSCWPRLPQCTGEADVGIETSIDGLPADRGDSPVGEVAEDDLPEHVAANREAWDRYAEDFVEPGERNWALAPGKERWGIFGL